MARHDAKPNSNSKATKRTTRSSKYLQQTLLTTHSHLTQQPTSTPPTPRKTNRKLRKDSISSNNSSEDSPVELQYSDSPPRKMDLSEDNNNSESTEPMDSTLEKLLVTRVDL